MEISESIYNNLFDVKFLNIKGFRESDYDLMRETFQEINKDFVSFELFEVNKKIQPLELLVKIISNKLVGELNIDLHNKEHEVLGKIIFRNFMFKKIHELIDFNYSSENKQKYLKVSYECDDVIYIGKDGKEEKI